ncbi:hypothetical protein DOY81_003538 [Sarcophaga bullata]|nr:hypothetical protein DOY81_003538 [Sarcophaga bullata]
MKYKVFDKENWFLEIKKYLKARDFSYISSNTVLEVNQPTNRMKLTTFEDFVKLANFFYATIGIQPYRKVDDEKDNMILKSVIFYSGLLNMNYVLFSEMLYVILALKNSEHFLEATMTMSYIGFVLVGNFKMLFIYRRKEALTKYISGLENIFPKTEKLQREYNMPHYLQQCSRITMGFSWLYMILIWTYNLFSIIQYLVYDLWLHIREVGQTLPYFMYVPWEWENNWTYYLLYALQDFAGYTSAAGQISSDLLLTACATQMVMHYDYTAYKLAAYESLRDSPGIKEEEAYAKDMQFLKKMIQYHDNLLNLSEQLNNVFGVPLLLNFATSSFVICFVGFQVTIGATPETIMKLLLFLVSSITQVYLICHYGQLLIDASTKVAYAVYEQNWHSADVRYKKMLVLIALRAQKPAILKATSFVLISRNTMTEVNSMVKSLVPKFEEFFKLADAFYITIGLVIFRKERFSKVKTLLATAIFYAGNINMNFNLVLESVYVSLAISAGNMFLEATMSFAYIGFVVVGNFKMVFMFIKKRELDEFIKNLQSIYPSNRKLQEDYKLHEYLRQCTRITVGFSLMYMIAVWIYNLYAVAEYLIFEKILAARDVERALPYLMYVPEDYLHHWSYYPLYVSQVYSGYNTVAGQISSDLLLISCCIQLTMHFSYLARSLESYKSKYQQANIIKQNEYKKDLEFISSKIKYHTFLLEISNQFCNIFGVPIFLNFAVSAGVICVLGFEMSIGASPEFVVKLTLFLAVCIAQNYAICYYSQELMDQSFNVSLAAYNQEWTDLDVRLQKMLLLIADHAQEPVQLKATNFMPISMETMSQLMQISYKCFTLVRTMYTSK